MLMVMLRSKEFSATDILVASTFSFSTLSWTGKQIFNNVVSVFSLIDLKIEYIWNEVVFSYSYFILLQKWERQHQNVHQHL